MRRGWLAGVAACALASACDQQGTPGASSLSENTTRADGQTIYTTCNYPGWSPDGTRIVFEYGPIFLDRDAPDDVGRREIYTVGIDGTGLTSIAAEPDRGEELKLGDWAFPNFPRWSPDGSKVLFQASTFWTEDDPDTQSEEDWLPSLYVVDIATHEVRPLKGEFMDGVAGSWSPDGSRILFSRATRTGVQRSQMDLWELDVASGEERRLRNDGQEEAPSAYSPDGQWILFNATPEDLGPAHPDFDESVWIMKADGSGKRLVLDAEGPERDGTWSPDGRTVALMAGSHTEGRIVLVPVDGGTPMEITGIEPPLLLSAKNPAWSPDGTKIAFCGDGEARFGLYVMTTDGAGKRGIVPFEAAADVGK